MPRSAVVLTISTFAASDSTRTPPPESAAPIPWADAEPRLAGERFYWLATTHPRGHSHVRPVLAVWLDGAMYVTTSPTAQKARNLERDGHCTLTARTD
ncbi:MAG TPA: pyridoxamine 5'-phosphate oxidase family protein, partial [Acidimicrobiales bacterium]|nr:pyridoxamine 5'-phosphate oxidase family protein [Acidimicrobiales bacterium]